ncbi:MAG: helix-turn-helix domain-containing protein [Nitrosarchaeum sp.]
MTLESADEKMYELDNRIKKICDLLVKYDLTPNQSKMYLYLSKIDDAKTALEISKSLRIPRTETYHILNNLEQKGIVFSVFGKPKKFTAIRIDQSIKILLDNEKNRIIRLELEKGNMVELWNRIPNNFMSMKKLNDDKFQTSLEKNPIYKN